MSNDIEKMLIKKAMKGDVDAFEKIVLFYEKKIYNIAFQMFKNEHDAYDASQEVFIKVYKSIDKFNFKASFSTWLHRIAVNTCIDEYRKKKRKVYNTFSLDEPVESESNSIERQIEDKSMTPEEIIMQNETVDEMRVAIQQLKEDHRIIIILRDIKGYAYEEIANILDCSVGTVKSRLSRARNGLKKIIVENKEQKSFGNVQ